MRGLDMMIVHCVVDKATSKSNLMGVQAKIKERLAAKRR